jgi:hypothetical protein
MSRSCFAICLPFLLLTAMSASTAPVCTTGELFAGAADFNDPMQRASEGQGLRDVPPLGWRSLVFVGGSEAHAESPRRARRSEWPVIEGW